MKQTPAVESHNVLLLASTGSPIESIRRALDRDIPVEEWNVLLVAYGNDHRSLHRAWHDRIEDAPANFGTISVGNDADTHREVDPISRTGRDVTTTVRNPADLTELGITVSLYLDDWSTERTLVCFHSLDALLTHVETERAFQFLHVLTDRLSEADAVGQFSLDPTALDEQTTRTLEPLFDTVDEDEAEVEPSISPDEVFDVLRAPRRRYVLHYFRERTGRTTVEVLADWVTRHEPNADPDRVETSLHHSHLPKLENARVIALDRPDVRAGPTIDAFGPYLDLVSEHDLSD